MGKNFPKISHDSYQNYNMAKIRKHSVLYQDNLKFVLYCIVLYCIVLGVALTRPLYSTAAGDTKTKILDQELYHQLSNS